MQLLLTFDNKGIIDIPVNYNYYIQSAIFTLLNMRHCYMTQHMVGNPDTKCLHLAN